MKTLLLITVITILVKAQYPEAPEKWSLPERIDNICIDRSAQTPSITSDGQKLFMSGIYYSTKSDSGWGLPIRLNTNVNQNIAGYPTISPNGKKLYFNKFVGDWRLFYSEWDTTINDWGSAIDCGEGVNGLEFGAFECAVPNDTTLIFVVASQTYISYWNSAENKWGQGVRFPTEWAQFATSGGIWASADLRKIYYVHYDGNYDIIVRYRDSSFSTGYTPPKILNISLMSDSLYNIGTYEGRNESHPSLSPDGKTMYFGSNYNGSCTYVSRMLIDENGNPVNVETENNNIPEKFELFNYPNPFNPTTTITYQIPKEGLVTLKIYDILGKEVTTLVNEVKQAGKYSLEFNASKLSSGVYLYELRSNEYKSTKKLLLMK